jgi:hypothetical protein
VVKCLWLAFVNPLEHPLKQGIFEVVAKIQKHGNYSLSSINLKNTTFVIKAAEAYAYFCTRNCAAAFKVFSVTYIN